MGAMLGGIDPLLADLDDDTRNVVLTLARIWSTLGTGAFSLQGRRGRLGARAAPAGAPRRARAGARDLPRSRAGTVG